MGTALPTEHVQPNVEQDRERRCGERRDEKRMRHRLIGSWKFVPHHPNDLQDGICRLLVEFDRIASPMSGQESGWAGAAAANSDSRISSNVLSALRSLGRTARKEIHRRELAEPKAGGYGSRQWRTVLQTRRELPELLVENCQAGTRYAREPAVRRTQLGQQRQPDIVDGNAVLRSQCANREIQPRLADRAQTACVYPTWRSRTT